MTSDVFSVPNYYVDAVTQLTQQYLRRSQHSAAVPAVQAPAQAAPQQPQTNSECTDGHDDGSISFGEAIESIWDGVCNTVKNAAKGAFCDDNGNFSPWQTAKTLGFTAVCCIPGIGPAVAATAGIAGFAVGGYQACTGFWKGLISAKTDAEAKQAWQEFGSGAFTAAISYKGVKAGINGMRNGLGDASKLTEAANQFAQDGSKWYSPKNWGTDAKALGADLKASGKQGWDWVKTKAKAPQIKAAQQKLDAENAKLKDAQKTLQDAKNTRTEKAAEYKKAKKTAEAEKTNAAKANQILEDTQKSNEIERRQLNVDKNIAEQKVKNLTQEKQDIEQSFMKRNITERSRRQTIDKKIETANERLSDAKERLMQTDKILKQKELELERAASGAQTKADIAQQASDAARRAHDTAQSDFAHAKSRLETAANAMEKAQAELDGITADALKPINLKRAAANASGTLADNAIESMQKAAGRQLTPSEIKYIRRSYADAAKARVTNPPITEMAKSTVSSIGKAGWYSLGDGWNFTKTHSAGDIAKALMKAQTEYEAYSTVAAAEIAEEKWGLNSPELGGWRILVP